MPANVKDTGSNIEYKKVPPGDHAAICYMVVMLGLQNDPRFGVKEKLYIGFQVPKQRVEYDKDGEHVNKPMSIGMYLTASLSTKAHLYHYLTAWRGKPFTKEELDGFDLFKLLGAPCLITVSHNKVGDKTYANIDQTRRFPKDGKMEIAGVEVTLPVPVLEGDLIKYSADEPGMLSKVPKWLQEKIAAQVDPAHVNAPQEGSGGGDGTTDDFQDSDIPFISNRGTY